MPTNRMERQSGLLIHPCNGARSYSSASHLNHLVTIALCSKIMYTACSISAWEKRRKEGRKGRGYDLVDATPLFAVSK